jgi:CRP/FNR family transcriptional regulator, cyclic AMP receptor protein
MTSQARALLDMLPATERGVLAEKLRLVTFPAGAYLFHVGQPGGALYVVESGRLGVLAGGERGRPAMLTTVGPGEVVGELAVLADEQRRTASVKALTPVSATELLATDLNTILNRHPRVYALFVQVLIGRIERLTQQVAELSELTGPVRLFRQLEQFRSVGGRASNVIRLSQDQLGSLTGMSLRAVNASIAEARDAGVLSTRRGAIVIHDWAEVRRRAVG